MNYGLCGGFGRSLFPLSTGAVGPVSISSSADVSRALSSVEHDTNDELSSAIKLRVRNTFFMVVDFYQMYILITI